MLAKRSTVRRLPDALRRGRELVSSNPAVWRDARLLSSGKSGQPLNARIAGTTNEYAGMLPGTTIS
jgi:hypothetical protein